MTCSNSRDSASSPGQFPTKSRNASVHRIGQHRYPAETNDPRGQESPVTSRQLPAFGSTAEVQGIEPLGPQCNPTPVLKTGEPTRRPDTSGIEPIRGKGSRRWKDLANLF